MTVSADLRNTVARVLAGINDDWPVAFKPSDAVSDPGYMVQWGGGGRDWRTKRTVAADDAALEVVVIAGRTDTGAAHDLLEELVDNAIPALHAAGYPHESVTAPAQLDIGGVAYLVARILVSYPLATRTAT
jgi:hypothetical protein